MSLPLSPLSSECVPFSRSQEAFAGSSTARNTVAIIAGGSTVKGLPKQLGKAWEAVQWSAWEKKETMANLWECVTCKGKRNKSNGSVRLKLFSGISCTSSLILIAFNYFIISQLFYLLLQNNMRAVCAAFTTLPTLWQFCHDIRAGAVNPRPDCPSQQTTCIKCSPLILKSGVCHTHTHTHTHHSLWYHGRIIYDIFVRLLCRACIKFWKNQTSPIQIQESRQLCLLSTAVIGTERNPREGDRDREEDETKFKTHAQNLN